MDKQRAAPIYSLTGTSIASCGCRVSIDCFCADELQTGCRTDCIAYHIDDGKIYGVTVASLNVVRVIQDQNSLLYLDEQATDEQLSLLIQAFKGELGGDLTDIDSLLPPCTAIKIAPIHYQWIAGKIELWILNTLVLQSRPKPFTFTTEQQLSVRE